MPHTGSKIGSEAPSHYEPSHKYKNKGRHRLSAIDSRNNPPTTGQCRHAYAWQYCYKHRQRLSVLPGQCYHSQWSIQWIWNLSSFRAGNVLNSVRLNKVFEGEPSGTTNNVKHSSECIQITDGIPLCLGNAQQAFGMEILLRIFSKITGISWSPMAKTCWGVKGKAIALYTKQNFG